jgi:prefoldin subunit 5
MDPILMGDVQEKVQEYTQFVDEVLRPEISKAKAHIEETELEISEYQQLSAKLREMQQQQQQPNKREEQPPQKRQVDLGYQTVYCQAEIMESAPTIFVHVGMGFHVEFQVTEALEFVDRRIEFLKTQVLPHREKKCAQIESHFQSSLNILSELERVQQH